MMMRKHFLQLDAVEKGQVAQRFDYHGVTAANGAVPCSEAVAERGVGSLTQAEMTSQVS